MKLSAEEFRTLSLRGAVISEINVVPRYMLSLTCQEFVSDRQNVPTVNMFELRFMKMQDFRITMPRVRCRIAGQNLLQRSDFLSSFTRRYISSKGTSLKDVFFHFYIEFEPGGIDVIAEDFFYLPIFSSSN